MTSIDMVRRIQEMPQLKGAKIGALSDLSSFKNVAGVIYIVNVRGDSKLKPIGDCACMIITASGLVHLELSTTLDEFWNHWARKRGFSPSQLSKIAKEVVHFFRNQKPAGKSLYCFRDGASNEPLHRAMRSIEKCSQLGQVFGYKLLTS